jgi:uncharacterized protein (DUF433 family)
MVFYGPATDSAYAAEHRIRQVIKTRDRISLRVSASGPWGAVPKHHAIPLLLVCRSIPMTYLMDRITVDPEMCGGRPCIRGMRIRVVDVLDLLAAGLSRTEILDEMPDLEDGDIDAALRFARSRVDHPILAAW